MEMKPISEVICFSVRDVYAYIASLSTHNTVCICNSK